jgi:pyruvate ferredoxin oxidoreductase beta subunit
MKATALNIPEIEYILPGNRTCPGCSLSLAYRHILKALDGKAIVTVPASCLTVLHGMYPITSVLMPCVNTPFASTGASATGLVAGLKAVGRKDLTVLAIAGDGGTHDIGIQALSGAAERQTDFLYTSVPVLPHPVPSLVLPRFLVNNRSRRISLLLWKRTTFRI